MAIEKMVLVTLSGNIEEINVAALSCSKLKAFHPEKASDLREYTKEYDFDENDSYADFASEIKGIAEKYNITLGEQKQEEYIGEKQESERKKQLISNFLRSNPYAELYQCLLAISEMCNCKFKYKYSESFDLNTADLEARVTALYNEISVLFKAKKELEKKENELSHIVSQMSHLTGMDILLDELFGCQMFKVRFGYMPHESCLKLKYYEDKPFVCFSYDNDGRYDWCLYMVPRGVHKETDNIFKALYFERIIVPGYDKSEKFTVDVVLQEAKEELRKVSAEIKGLNVKIEGLAKGNLEFLQQAYCKIKFLKKCLELKQYASVVRDRFYLVGFVPRKSVVLLEEMLAQTAIDMIVKDAADEDRLQTPVKLKNGKWFKAFESLMGMYGLPSYGSFDPTKFFTVVYMLLFGIMFGDLGQGLVISLIGTLLYKFKKVSLGKVMAQIGLCSAFFGFLYCSVFGNEEILVPVHNKLFGSDGPLIAVGSSEMTLKILFAAVVIGVVLLINSIVLNIITNIRQGNWVETFFSQKCIAGLVFYCSLILLVVAKFIPDFDVNVKLLVWFGILLPLILIFLKKFMTYSVREKKFGVEDGVGNYILLNTFELIEIALSFISNTLSFLRIGGFILSHAGLMLTISIISRMFPNSSVIIAIFGNALVIALEGLIVGVQVLRLEFYELFSRSFDGGGKQFEPFGVEV
ncbi:MAG: V-type ATP synthase subunit I [Oscillospiraceae bacterium]